MEAVETNMVEMMAFNKLTDAQAERLAMLAEECAEVIKAVNKILRHGYRSFNPNMVTVNTNRMELEEELIDLDAVRWMMMLNGDISSAVQPGIISARAEKKKRFMHHAEK